MAAAGEKPVEVVGTEKVLCDEYRLIFPDDRDPPRTEAEYYAKVQERGQAALCLSGGGIRSAAFALGVLQALSRKGLLTGFHYLSTVSGGGYIGSWLQRWIHEEGSAARVAAKLGAVREPAEVSALRENSNFITPRVGIGSNDTWTAVSISGRNIALNWLLFGPLLMAVTVIPHLFAASVGTIAQRAAGAPWLLDVAILSSALFAWIAAFFVVKGLPSYRAGLTVRPANADGWLTLRIVLPLVLWSISGTLALAIDLFSDHPSRMPGLYLAIVSLAGSIAGLVAGSVMLSGAKRGEGPGGDAYRKTFYGDMALWATALVLGAVAMLLGARLFAELAGALPQAGPAIRPEVLTRADLLAFLGPLWLMATQLLVAIVFAGFRKADGPTVRPDADREWLARLSAVKIKPMLLWAVVGFAVLLLDWALRRYASGYDMSLSGFIALLSGGAAIAGGKSDKSAHSTGGIKRMANFAFKYLPMPALIALATAIFILSLFLILGRIEENLALWMAAAALENGKGWPAWASWADPQVVAHCGLLAILCALLLFFRGRIQVNRFSLNGLYRNRLARAFLGGARRARHPDPFTGFDAADNVRMHQLRPPPGSGAVLYPVVNVALNVTASEKLAWQERKAEPFIFTPLYSGSAMLKPPEWQPELREGQVAGAALPPDPSEPPGAYVSSSVYGGNEPDLAMEGQGVSLATAMSISGAAASPNMGYHTSAATAFLMTLFNVRLGAWLPNPAQAKKMGDAIRRSGPNDSLRAILRELGGATDDRGWDIYLSDGGHFENLGVYEMLRRRCRFILVSDAGADPECTFFDLGAAVRKAKIDLDIDVHFSELRLSKRGAGHDPPPQRAWALGQIRYPEGGTGQMLYVKPSFFGRDLPVDIVAYAAGSATFPHESTGDQFFSESQFESYRHLGAFFAEPLGVGKTPAADIEEFFVRVAKEQGREQNPINRAVRSVKKRLARAVEPKPAP
jgi:hypothetical protein